jgi:hypothetical protein
MSDEATPARPSGASDGTESTGGRRTHSHIVLRSEVTHHGDPHVLGEHLCVEVTALLERWGHECDMTVVEQTEVLFPGDSLSRNLPAICPHRPARGAP